MCLFQILFCTLCFSALILAAGFIRAFGVKNTMPVVIIAILLTISFTGTLIYEIYLFRKKQVSFAPANIEKNIKQRGGISNDKTK